MTMVNGRPMELTSRTLYDFLVDMGCDPNKVAIDLNGEYVPKIWYSKTTIRDGDVIEVENQGDGSWRTHDI